MWKVKEFHADRQGSLQQEITAWLDEHQPSEVQISYSESAAGYHDSWSEHRDVVSRTYGALLLYK